MFDFKLFCLSGAALAASVAACGAADEVSYRSGAPQPLSASFTPVDVPVDTAGLSINDHEFDHANRRSFLCCSQWPRGYWLREHHPYHNYCSLIWLV